MKRRPKILSSNVVGWRERVSLPDLAINDVDAKIDTGARTSALHAEELEIFRRNNAYWVRFLAPSGSDELGRVIEMPLLEKRDIKNTSGIAQTRPVIRTAIELGQNRWDIEVSLTDRKNMEYDLILGRTALRVGRLMVDPGRSYLKVQSSQEYAANPVGNADVDEGYSQQGEEE